MIEVGQQRRFTVYNGPGGASRKDPHTVLRVSTMNREVYIKYSDKTTEWCPIGMYELETAPVE